MEDLLNNIALRQIDESNFLDCFALELAAGQEKFVSSPIRSLAQAYVYRNQCTPFGVFAGGRMVGYVMVIYDYDEQTYNVWHLMIDRRFQGRGYGKRALDEALRYIRTKPFGASGTVLLTCSPENEIALRLYRRAGFTETGRSGEDEIELNLQL